jgi:hypothetical protein
MDSLAFKLADWGWAIILLLLGICLALVRMVRQGDIERIYEANIRINARLDQQDVRIDEILSTFHKLEIAATETSAAVRRIASDLESEKATRDRAHTRVIDKLDQITQRIEQRATRARGDC